MTATLFLLLSQVQSLNHNSITGSQLKDSSAVMGWCKKQVRLTKENCIRCCLSGSSIICRHAVAIVSVSKLNENPGTSFHILVSF